MQRFVSYATFVCPTCKEQVGEYIEVPEPDWGAMESLSDLSGEGTSEVACPSCKTSFLCQVQVSGGEVDITFEDHGGVAVHARDPMFWPPEEWVNEAIPDSPWEVFDASMNEIGQMCDAAGRGDNANVLPLLTQMLYSQSFSVLEANLCDTLIKRVTEDGDALLRLVRTDEELRKLRFPLEDILTGKALVEDTVRGFLQKIVYHNLARVERLYACALDVRFWPDEDVKAALHRAVQVRNDCVHRNGRTLDGEPLGLAVDGVRELLGHCRALAEQVQRGIEPPSEF